MRYLSFVFAIALPVHAASVSRGTVDYVRTLPTVREFTKPRNIFSKVFEWVVGPSDDKHEIVRPFATTHDSAGRLFIADPDQHGVHMFDFEKHKYQFIKGPRGKEMLSPMDVACDAADNLFVTDSVRARLYVFDVKGKFRRAIGGSKQEPGFQRPTGLALDRKAQRLYVADTLGHQVIVLGLDGKLLQIIGQRGAAQGEFNFPTTLALSAGKLYVVDAMNFRIQSFTLDGKFAGSFGQLGNQTGTFSRPKGIAADSDGNLYIVDALFATVQVFDPDGRLLYYFGSTGAKPGQFQLPSGISMDDRNVIYVADSFNRRVQVFHYRRLE